jgi:hypothetical protein
MTQAHRQQPLLPPISPRHCTKRGRTHPLSLPVKASSPETYHVSWNSTFPPFFMHSDATTAAVDSSLPVSHLSTSRFSKEPPVFAQLPDLPSYLVIDSRGTHRCCRPPPPLGHHGQYQPGLPHLSFIHCELRGSPTELTDHPKLHLATSLSDSAASRISTPRCRQRPLVSPITQNLARRAPLHSLVISTPRS